MVQSENANIMRIGLGTKLLVVILGLLAVLTAGALLTVRQEFGQQLRRQAERELRAGSQVLISILGRSGAQLQDRARVLAELPSLRAALSKERGQLEPLLQEVKAIRAANLLWATDAEGNVVGCTGEYPPVGENLSKDPLILAALNGQQTLGFDLFGGQWWLVLSLPVLEGASPGEGETAKSRRLGTVTLALLVGEAYMSRLAELMGTRVGFIWGENRLWSPGWPEAVRTMIASDTVKGFGEQPQEAVHPEGRYLWLARSVTGGHPPIAAGPIALLGSRLDESVIVRTSRVIGWIAFLTMGIGALLLTWAVRSITRPVKVLVADTQRIGGGDLSHRTDVHGRDEIADLAASFNQMVERLEKSYKDLGNLNRTLQDRVRERTRQLEDAQAQLLQAEKLASLGELAAGVAHELNNPLMVIMGNTQLGLRMLKDPQAPPPTLAADLKDLLKIVEDEAHRSKGIVSNLLDFSRVKPTVETPTDLHLLLDDSLKLVEHQVSMQSIHVEKQYGKGLPTVKVDPGQIKQVLINIILNAVQAMPDGGNLTLKTGSTDSFFNVKVEDTGIGIPEENLRKVFDPFFTTKEVGAGTGLGLSVSYGIIRRHRGHITLTSKVREGTQVTIQFPLK
ncbi:MAG: HAMP domain-containing protein [Candidatus Omnitrophica bacterium]|nr:HAMP domain-containing protein [Candidatus Omnitrophota bacterium]